MADNHHSEMVSARRTESVDAAIIQKLVKRQTEELFGRVNIINLIERSNMAVTLSNEEDELMANAMFVDYPNVPGVDQADWERWLHAHYDTALSNPLNSLFLHFFVSRANYSHGAAEEIATTVFHAVPQVHYLYLFVPPSTYPDSALATMFKPVTKLQDGAGVGPGAGYALFVCRRESHAPVLHVRRARVQDHDDLAPVFERQGQALSATYGDFFLAEMIEAQSDDMHCLAAEIEGTAVGFMSICTELNVDLLNECFELSALHGLRKPHPDDVLPRPVVAKTDVDALQPGRVAVVTKLSEQHLDAEPKTASSESTESADGAAGGPPAVAAAGGGGGSSSGSSDSKSSLSAAASEASLAQQQPQQQQPTATLASTVASASASAGVAGRMPTSQMPRLPAPRGSSESAVYAGGSNAFCIQLFCIDERHEMRSVDFLAVAFEKFPDKEFAVITTPHMVPEFPLLQKFLRVTPKTSSTLGQELYVFHRMALSESFVVRSALPADYAHVEKLVANISMHDSLLADLRQFNEAGRDPDGTEIQAFVADVLGQVVGVAILRREEDVEYVRSHYYIEDFIYYSHHAREEHGHLHHFVLNPIFASLSKHFLKEVLRLGHKTALYYPIFPVYASDSAAQRKHSLVTCLSDMVPVRARRQIVYALGVLEDRAPSKRVLQKKEPFALCHFNRKLTLEPKVAINARIVVVGASDVATAYLETLSFCSHLRFNNLTLISPHGLPGEMANDEIRDNVLGETHCYGRDDYAHSSLRSWVNVVYGKMTAIDRKKKQVTVNGGAAVISYDHLVIACGLQHQCPAPVATSAGSRQYDPSARFDGAPPKNLFSVNDDYDAAVALYWLENRPPSRDGRIVVYGNDIRCWFAIQAMLAIGIEGRSIFFVNPPTEEPTCFNNPEVDDCVDEALRQAGVQHHRGFYLADWNGGDWQDGQDITSCVFTAEDGRRLFVNCSIMLSFYAKQVDYSAFRALNDACLVFDGKLVINSTFHTNDVAIRAAGPVTKFQRKYHADPWTHGNFNSKEIGIELAVAMLALFDPSRERQHAPHEESLTLMPIYSAPKIDGGVLPGGYHYLKVAKPSLALPLKKRMEDPDYGRVLSTGKPGGSQSYFRLHFNKFNTIETVTCLSSVPFEVSNVICLYGLHQRFLNNIMGRYDEGLITDLYGFFREAWCMAIFHDRFADFRDEIRELLVNQPAPDVAALEDKVRQLVDDDLMLTKLQRSELASEYLASGVKKAVDTRLLSFLAYNYYHLPMYAKPGMV